MLSSGNAAVSLVRLSFAAFAAFTASTVLASLASVKSWPSLSLGSSRPGYFLKSPDGLRSIKLSWLASRSELKCLIFLRSMQHLKPRLDICG
jgi:hypothetical protein